MAVKLVAEARQEILVEDQVRLRVLAHETFLELATPLQTFNDRLFKLLDDYELLPATDNILDQFYADIGRLCDWFEVEIYDAMVNANLNILETVEKDLAVEYVIMGRYTSAAMKSDDMPPLSTDWRKPFHPKKKITKTFGISVNKANARILKAMGHNAYDPEVADRMLQNPLVTAKNFSRATREQIKNIMYKGIQRGEPIPTTSARVRQIIPKRNYNRALQIVWTETHNTMNFVKWKEYMKDDAIEHIQWITVGDRRVRPTHRRNHLQIIKKGETFRNGQRFPGDRSASIREWIRCRCTLTPYILEPSNVAHPRTRTPMQMVRYKKAGWRPTPPKVPETLRRGYRPVLPSVEIVKPAKPRETVVEKPVEPIKPAGGENKEWLYNIRGKTHKSRLFKDNKMELEKPGQGKTKWEIYEDELSKVYRDPETEFSVIFEKPAGGIYECGLTVDEMVDMMMKEVRLLPKQIKKNVKEMFIEYKTAEEIMADPRAGFFSHQTIVVCVGYNTEIILADFRATLWHEVGHMIDFTPIIKFESKGTKLFNKLVSESERISNSYTYYKSISTFVAPARPYTHLDDYVEEAKKISDYSKTVMRVSENEVSKFDFTEAPAEWLRLARINPEKIEELKKEYPNLYNSLKLAAAENGIDFDAMLEEMKKMKSLRVEKK